MVNLAESFVSSLEACIELCASFNYWGNTQKCVTASFMAAGVMPGNCWAISNGTATGSGTDFIVYDASGGVDIAVLTGLRPGVGL